MENAERTELRITEEADRAEKELQALRMEIRADLEKHDQRVRAVATRVESVSADGLDWTMVGAWWVIIGQVYGSFPGEIASALGMTA